MKRNGIIAVWIIIVAVFCSCEGFELDGLLEDFNVGFGTDYYEVEFAIPPAPAGFEITIETPMQFDLEEQLAANGYGGFDVNSIKIMEANLEVCEGSNIPNLNPIDYVSASISTDSLSWQTIASLENTVIDAQVLPMETTDEDLTNYLDANEYNLATSGMLKEAITDTLWIKGKIRYKVSVTVSSL